MSAIGEAISNILTVEVIKLLGAMRALCPSSCRLPLMMIPMQSVNFKLMRDMMLSEFNERLEDFESWCYVNEQIDLLAYFKGHYLETKQEWSKALRRVCPSYVKSL